LSQFGYIHKKNTCFLITPMDIITCETENSNNKYPKMEKRRGENVDKSVMIWYIEQKRTK